MDPGLAHCCESLRARVGRATSPCPSGRFANPAERSGRASPMRLNSSSAAGSSPPVSPSARATVTGTNLVSVLPMPTAPAQRDEPMSPVTSRVLRGSPLRAPPSVCHRASPPSTFSC